MSIVSPKVRDLGKKRVGSDRKIEMVMNGRPERGPGFRPNGSVATMDLDHAIRGEFFFDLQNR